MSAGRPLFVSLGGQEPVPAHVRWDGPAGHFRVTVDDQPHALSIERRDEDGTLHVRVDDKVLRVRILHDDDGRPRLHFLDEDLPPMPVRTVAADRLALQRQRPPRTVAPEPLVGAPIAGEILEVLVREGQQVHRETPLLRMEAMKMEVEVRSHAPGTIAQLHVQTGDRVRIGAPLVLLDLSGVVFLR